MTQPRNDADRIAEMIGKEVVMDGDKIAERLFGKLGS